MKSGLVDCISILLDQGHLLRLAQSVRRCQAIEVNAAAQVAGAEVQLMFAGGHLLVSKRGHQLAFQVVDLEANVLGRLQAELDRGVGVEGVGIVLLQLQALGQDRIGHPRFHCLATIEGAEGQEDGKRCRITVHVQC